MPQSVVTTLSQKIEIKHVVDVAVTEAVLDEDTGEYVRALRIFGEPVTGEQGLLVLEVTIRSATADAIKVSTPELSF